MKLTYEQVSRMNKIQIDIFKAFITVCEKLNLHYYMVHGSLLGAYTRGSFYPYDDDIDVAMPRKDYDILMEKGQQYIQEGYFIQSCQTEKEFPLAFGKVRDNNTAFVQNAFKGLNVNKGVYIDVFPIDFYPNNKIQKIFIRTREFLLSARISTRIHYDEKQPLWRIISRAISIFLAPSWEKAVKTRSRLYAGVQPTENIIIIGAKPSERGIPAKWFEDSVNVPFEGLSVKCPICSDQYLKHIYGDYKNYDPVHEYENEDGTLTVSAYIFDLENSYLNYKE